MGSQKSIYPWTRSSLWWAGRTQRNDGTLSSTGLAVRLCIRGRRAPFAEKVVEVAEFVVHQIQLAGEVLDLRFGAAVHFEVQLATQAVLFVLAILAHHDDGGLDGGEHGEEEVQQDERVG